LVLKKFVNSRNSLDGFEDLAGDVDRDMSMLDIALIIVIVEGGAFDDCFPTAAKPPMIRGIENYQGSFFVHWVEDGRERGKKICFKVSSI